MTWLHMAHVGPLPPMWDLLDHQPAAETLYFQSASISGQRRRYTDIHSDVLLHRRLRRGKRIISGCGQYQSNECRIWRWFSDNASNSCRRCANAKAVRLELLIRAHFDHPHEAHPRRRSIRPRPPQSNCRQTLPRLRASTICKDMTTLSAR